MTNVAPECGPEVIARYLADELDPEATAALLSCLDTCPDCQQRVQAAAGSEDEWLAAGRALRTDDFDDSLADWESDACASGEAARAAAWSQAILGPTDDPEMLGRIGAFEVRACVGIGGMGIVFKARDPSLDRYVAVKVLAPHLASSRTARERFAREARAAAAVVHGNVIEIHHVSEWQGLPFLVMPYLTGPSLQQRLDESGPLDVDEALRVALQVAEGLSAAHTQGLVHRDVKPANILLCGQTERAILTDFGLARAADDETLTRTGVLAGTPQYMSPEQARGESIGVASDLFGLGSVLFTMLTGEPPVRGEDGSDTIRRIASSPPPRLRENHPELPEWLECLVTRLHAFSPADRVASADETGRLLSSALAHLRQPDERPVPPELESSGSHRGGRSWLAALGLAGTAALVTFAFLPERENAPPVVAVEPAEDPELEQRFARVRRVLESLRRIGDDGAVLEGARDRARELASEGEFVLESLQELRSAIEEEGPAVIEEMEAEVDEVEGLFLLFFEEFELETALVEAEDVGDDERIREIESQLRALREELDRHLDDEPEEDDDVR